MKKSIFLLSAVAAFCLVACNKGKPQEPSMEPEKAPTTEVAFDEITNTVLVTDEVKQYIDLMKEQEKLVQYPDRISTLFGPDYNKMAGKQYNDGAKYKDDEKGGVDVCDYLKSSQDYKSVPVEVKWQKGEKDYSDAKVRFWTEMDHSDVREAKVESDGSSAKLTNLLRATTYYYQLVNGDEVSQMGNFTTADYTRTISMPQIENIRDLGGYISNYGGVRINQNLIYRGFELNDKAFTDGGNRHSVNWSTAGQEVNLEIMKIGVELDLRTKSGSGSRTTSVLEGAEYKRCAINSFGDFVNSPARTSESENKDRNLVVEIFDYLKNADQKHVYFHCWGGADRTGTIAFLLNAICGVSYTDLVIDYELTSQSNTHRCHMHESDSGHFPAFLKAFTAMEGYDENKTVNENSVTLLKSFGVTDETIEKIRTIMIPGYKTGMQPTERINNIA